MFFGGGSDIMDLQVLMISLFEPLLPGANREGKLFGLIPHCPAETFGDHRNISGSVGEKQRTKSKHYSWNSKQNKKR